MTGNESMQSPKLEPNRDLFYCISDSEKFHEMETATEMPPQQCFLLDDDGEFPPMVPSVQ